MPEPLTEEELKWLKENWNPGHYTFKEWVAGSEKAHGLLLRLLDHECPDPNDWAPVKVRRTRATLPVVGRLREPQAEVLTRRSDEGDWPGFDFHPPDSPAPEEDVPDE